MEDEPSRRGQLGIHVAKEFPDWAREFFYRESFQTVLVKAGYLRPDDLPIGTVVAVAFLGGVKRIPGQLVFYHNPFSQSEPYRRGSGSRQTAMREFGNFQEGRYAWVFESVSALPKPIPASGGQRLWDWNPAFPVFGLQPPRAG